MVYGTSVNNKIMIQELCKVFIPYVLQPQVEDIERTIRARDAKIQEIKENMNNVEDVVFRGFCRDIGVANIRSVTTIMFRFSEECILSCIGQMQIYSSILEGIFSINPKKKNLHICLKKKKKKFLSYNLLSTFFPDLFLQFYSYSFIEHAY